MPDVTYDYIRIEEGDSGTLDLIFSYSFVPAGQFQFSDIPSNNTRIFLNTQNNDFYQHGIPGLAPSIDAAAAWLENAIAQRRPKTIRTIGSSMAAYAALLYGHLLGADAIYVSGPLLRLGDEFCRSSEWYHDKQYDPPYQDITPLIPSLLHRSRIVFPLFELFEYRQIAAFLDYGLDQLYFCNEFHPAFEAFNWASIIQSSGTPHFCDAITVKSRQTFPYERDQVSLLHNAYLAVRQREDNLALRLLAQALDSFPANHGIRYRLGVQQALAGLPHAVDTIRSAMEGIWDTRPDPTRVEQFRKAWDDRVREDYAMPLKAPELRFVRGLFDTIWPGLVPP
jgi:hypothetical protein